MLLSLKNIFPGILACLLLALSHPSQAQLKRYPADQRSPLGAQQPEKQRSSARTKATPPLSLPFFDDFSSPTAGLYADTSLWENSYSVWVNDGMAIRPPTIYVATFDGLNARGMPYNPNEVLLTGYTDTLMSRPIDLSEASVPLAEREGVYLSFMYQWQGNIEPPDERDYLELSFKTAEENGWETVMTINQRDGFDATLFYDTIIQVSGEQFFHENFQFRLRAYGRMSGPFDTWHIDYVYLNKGRNEDDLSFPDRAVSTQLGPLFGKYRAIPRHHFFSNDQMTPPEFEIQNMKNESASIDFRTDGYFSSTNRETGTTYPAHDVMIAAATPINIDNSFIAAREHKLIRMGPLPDINDPLQFPQDPDIDSTLIRLTIALQTNDDDPSRDYTPNYVPIQFTANDTITADYVLSDYFAYDDGVAEFAAGLIRAGNLVAYEFEIDTTYALKQDTLIAFDIYFPPYAITSNQTVTFFIYHEDLDNPGLPGEQWLRIASKPIKRKGLNEFQRIEFLPALLIDEKKFYIGWQEPSAGKVMVGLDISNDTGDKIFVNTNGTWYQNEDVKGSLMVRPVFGSGIIDATVGIGEEESRAAIYPNPGKGTFFIEGDVSDLRMYSVTGQPVPFESVSLGERLQVRVETAAPGVYLMRYRHGTVLKSAKIIIRQE